MSQPVILSNLELIDKPLATTSTSPLIRPVTNSRASSGTGTKRVSRVPPTPSVPSAGPSSPSRYLYVAVRSGHTRGVYTDWFEAERQLIVSVGCEGVRLI
jgi:hypothetical protein